MKTTGSYQQVKAITPLRKTVERKTPLSQPGKYNQKAMENAKPIYTNTGKY